MAVTRRKKKDIEPITEEEKVVEDIETSSPSPQIVSTSAPISTSQPPYLLIVLLMAVSFFCGYLVFKVMNLQKTIADSKQQPQAQQQIPQRPTEIKIKKPSAKDDHWNGMKSARYVWVEYSDFECPFCKRFHPDILKLHEEYFQKMGWVYRHFPLPIHPKAQKSAEASECAFDQGGDEAFWKMGDLIFEKMPTLELTELPSLAAQAGLNESTLKQCLDSGKFENKVKTQLDEGNKAGVQATPTGVIYDLKTGKSKVVEGALPYDSLKQELDSFLAANK